MTLIKASKLNDIRHLVDEYNNLKKFFETKDYITFIEIDVDVIKNSPHQISSTVDKYKSKYIGDMKNLFITSLKSYMKGLGNRIQELGVNPGE